MKWISTGIKENESKKKAEKKLIQIRDEFKEKLETITTTKECVKVRKEKFSPTYNEEAETHIWIDFCLGQVIVEPNQKATYYRL